MECGLSTLPCHQLLGRYTTVDTNRHTHIYSFIRSTLKPSAVKKVIAIDCLSITDKRIIHAFRIFSPGRHTINAVAFIIAHKRHDTESTSVIQEFLTRKIQYAGC